MRVRRVFRINGECRYMVCTPNPKAEQQQGEQQQTGPENEGEKSTNQRADA